MCRNHKQYYNISCGICDNLTDMLPGIVLLHIYLPSMILIVIIIKYSCHSSSCKYITVNIYRPKECRCRLQRTWSIKREKDKGGHRHGIRGPERSYYYYYFYHFYIHSLARCITPEYAGCTS